MPSFSTGDVMLRLFRRGDLDDDLEAAVVFRDLRVSEIEGAGADRAPTYPRPRPPADLGYACWQTAACAQRIRPTASQTGRPVARWIPAA